MVLTLRLVIYLSNGIDIKTGDILSNGIDLKTSHIFV